MVVYEVKADMAGADSGEVLQHQLGLLIDRQATEHVAADAGWVPRSQNHGTTPANRAAAVRR